MAISSPNVYRAPGTNLGLSLGGLTGFLGNIITGVQRRKERKSQEKLKRLGAKWVALEKHAESYAGDWSEAVREEKKLSKSILSDLYDIDEDKVNDWLIDAEKNFANDYGDYKRRGGEFEFEEWITQPGMEKKLEDRLSIRDMRRLEDLKEINEAYDQFISGVRRPEDLQEISKSMYMLLGGREQQPIQQPQPTGTVTGQVPEEKLITEKTTAPIPPEDIPTHTEILNNVFLPMRKASTIETERKKELIKSEIGHDPLKIMTPGEKFFPEVPEYTKELESGENKITINDKSYVDIGPASDAYMQEVYKKYPGMKPDWIKVQDGRMWLKESVPGEETKITQRKEIIGMKDVNVGSVEEGYFIPGENVSSKVIKENIDKIHDIQYEDTSLKKDDFGRYMFNQYKNESGRDITEAEFWQEVEDGTIDRIPIVDMESTSPGNFINDGVLTDNRKMFLDKTGEQVETIYDSIFQRDEQSGELSFIGYNEYRDKRNALIQYIGRYGKILDSEDNYKKFTDLWKGIIDRSGRWERLNPDPTQVEMYKLAAQTYLEMNKMDKFEEEWKEKFEFGKDITKEQLSLNKQKLIMMTEASVNNQMVKLMEKQEEQVRARVSTLEKIWKSSHDDVYKMLKDSGKDLNSAWLDDYNNGAFRAAWETYINTYGEYMKLSDPENAKNYEIIERLVKSDLKIPLIFTDIPLPGYTEGEMPILSGMDKDLIPEGHMEEAFTSEEEDKILQDLGVKLNR